MPDVTGSAADDTITPETPESRRTILKRGAAAAAAAAVAGVIGARRAEAAPSTHLLYLSAKYQNLDYYVAGLFGGGTIEVDGGSAANVPGTSLPVSLLGTHGGTNGVGVAGSASGTDAIGVYGRSTVGAALALGETPITTVPPTSGAWAAGSFLVKSGELWYCYTAGTGTASKWVKISAALKTLASPSRAYDSRSSSPISGGQTRVIDLTAAGVPDNSTAALISLQLINTVGAGFLSVYSASVGTLSPPPFSTMQWSSAGQRLANEVTTAVSTTGGIKVYGGGKTDFFIDVVGYYP